MITSPPGHEDLVGNADRFKDDKTGENIIKHVTELAMKKYKVEIPNLHLLCSQKRWDCAWFLASGERISIPEAGLSHQVQQRC